MSAAGRLGGLLRVLRVAPHSVYRQSVSSQMSSASCNAPAQHEPAPVASHDVHNKAFLVEIEGAKERGILEYNWIKEDVVDLYHTGVPHAFRGKGIAKILAKTALDYFVEKDAKMILTCTYLVKYVKDHPLEQYTSRIYEG